MGRKKGNTKKNIVSCRIDDIEMDMLKQRAFCEGMSITAVMRGCINLFLTTPTPKLNGSIHQKKMDI